jgi:hypothetical protein
MGGRFFWNWILSLSLSLSLSVSLSFPIPSLSNLIAAPYPCLLRLPLKTQLTHIFANTFAKLKLSLGPVFFPLPGF